MTRARYSEWNAAGKRRERRGRGSDGSQTLSESWLHSALTPRGDLQPADLRRAQRIDHVVGHCFGYVDERERVVDLDCADQSRLNPDLARDRADEVAGAYARSPARADKQAGEISLDRGPGSITG